MKILLTLLFLLAGLTVGAYAQRCGTYTTSLLIRDEAGKPVDNAEVKIIPLRQGDGVRGKAFAHLAENPSRLFITFNENESVKGNYKIVVSAEGFLTAEKVISFPHCQSKMFEFRLKTAEVLSRTILTRVMPEEMPKKQNVSKLCGTVIDKMRAVIPGVTIKVKSNNKGIFKTTTDAEGNFELELPDGVYKIIMKQKGFKKVVMKNQSLPYQTESCRNYILISTVKEHRIT